MSRTIAAFTLHILIVLLGDIMDISFLHNYIPKSLFQLSYDVAKSSNICAHIIFFYSYDVLMKGPR